MIQMLRLINPPGHARRKPFPRYAGGGRARSNAGHRQHPRSLPLTPAQYERRAARMGSEPDEPLPGYYLRYKRKKPKTNPKSRSKSMPKKRRMPPRYKSGPKKGQFMPKAARRRKVARKRIKTNPPKVTHVSATGKKRKLVLSKLGKKGRALYRTKYKGKTVPTSAVPGIIDEINRYRKRSKPVAKKRKSKKAKKSTKRHVTRRHGMSKAKRRAAAKKGWARRRRTGTVKVKRVRKARKHTVRKHVAKRRVSRRRTRVLYLKARPRSRKLKAYRLKRGRKPTKRGFNHYSVARNPGNAIGSMLKDGAMLFGGILGMRVLGNALKTYVIDKYMSSMTASLGSAAKVLPGALSFVLAAFSGKFIKNPKIVATVQTGAAIALFDGIFQAFVKPAVATNPTAAALLAGVDDYGYRGYGEYVPAQRQLGYDVQEAMALDEYIPGQGGMGFDVSEALAESEVQGFQAGYAGGSLSKTVFHS